VNDRIHMTSSYDDSDDKVVVDTVKLEAASPLPAQWTMDRRDDPPPVIGRGTRDQPFARDPPAARLGARVLDPVAVLRMWPHSVRARDDMSGVPLPVAASNSTPLAAAPVRSTTQDKIVLAHLALDLFRELEADAHSAHAAPGTAPCTNQACEARIAALRGGLVEARLLVQRVVMMMPLADGAVEDHVRELLELIGR
jgi:hypothetical protein